MAIFDELLAIKWPREFIVEFESGARERLLRGEGVCITPPTDDPEGIGGLDANLPKKHPRNQRQCGRYVRFTELRAIYSIDGHRLWPDA